MTNEQREAIKNLDEFANTKYGAFSAKEGQTVLSLIKEQQEKIEKKDKQIDLMAEFIGQDMMCIRPEIECNKMTHDCKNCIKQYFERKVKNENKK